LRIVGASNTAYRLHATAQIAIVALIGGPYSACWMINHNARASSGQANHYAAYWGISGTFFLHGLVLFIVPERFPR